MSWQNGQLGRRSAKMSAGRERHSSAAETGLPLGPRSAHTAVKERSPAEASASACSISQGC